MNWEAIGAIGEVVGAIAVVATLAYLALQIRQNTKSTRTAAETAISQNLAGWIAQGVNDPELSRIYDVAVTDPETLTDEDARRFLWYIAEYFVLFESQFVMFLNGDISHRTWGVKAHVLLGLLENPLVRNWWDSRATTFSPDFIEYLESLRDEAPKWTPKSLVEETKAPPNE